MAIESPALAVSIDVPFPRSIVATPVVLLAGEKTILSPYGRGWNDMARFEPEICKERAVFTFDLTKSFRFIPRHLHFIYNHNELPDAEKPEQISVPPAFFAHIFVCRYHKNRRVSIECSRDHVL